MTSFVGWGSLWDNRAVTTVLHHVQRGKGPEREAPFAVSGGSMKERLQKILSRAGISSRRRAEELIAGGRVAVNGTVITEPGTKADPETDAITVDGRPIQLSIVSVYLVLYKPAGYMTTLKDPQGRPLVTDLLTGIRERVYPVGRLDYNTEGLLLLTNDGEWANALAHPRHEVDKEYHVRVRGKVSPEQLRRLAGGVELEDGKAAPAVVRIVRESENNTWLSIAIHEGRYRQIRRMCEAVSLTVVRLKRVRYGFLGLEGLKTGEYRFLTDDEAARLRRSNQGGKAAEKDSPAPAKSRERKPQEKAVERKAQEKAGEKKRAGAVPVKSGTRRR
jgi:23S rRNA pseudouridine2605 synthase